jgi:hypothetical protein
MNRGERYDCGAQQKRDHLDVKIVETEFWGFPLVVYPPDLIEVEKFPNPHERPSSMPVKSHKVIIPDFRAARQQRFFSLAAFVPKVIANVP